MDYGGKMKTEGPDECEKEICNNTETIIAKR